MRICFYAPFKPLGHPNPSGDLIIATGLYDFLISRGHEVLIASTLRSRWIFLKPWRFAEIFLERMRCRKRVRKFAPDLWLSYHCYYKAPDLLGPFICKNDKIPYCIFQGIYSTKQRRRLKAKAGFYLNRHSLLLADRVFSNRKRDLENLKRIIPPQRLSRIRPGILPEQFVFDKAARHAIHKEWDITKVPVIITAAMFRPDVKSLGLSWMIRTLARLTREGVAFKLVIAGDGSQRQKLEELAAEFLPGQVVFLGKVPRKEMYRVYSGGDIFAFPGIRESLGMVYLEAQSCGLPVVAFDNGGIPEVVQPDRTAYLTPSYDEESFCKAVKTLLNDADHRHKMGRAATEYVRSEHDLNQNYLHFEEILHDHAHTS
jgi:glycosyltransferase involved in cell wall biosynthesis